MSDNESPAPPRSLEEQFRDLFKKANVSFVMPGAPAAAVEPPSAAAEGEGVVDPLKPIREFSLKPREVKEYLDRFVIQQDEAKRVLSVAICDHYNHVRRCLANPALREAEYAKHNIILLGPTGVGKTYLMRCIAKLIKVPFVKADATKFSETGYVGHDVEDLVRDLVKAAGNDVDLAQYGIIYLDEVDKIASQPMTSGKDVSGRGVQINLLKLMEETDVSLFSQTDLLGQMQAIMDMQRGKGPGRRTINTRHMLFIVSGAFDKLGDQVRRRVRSSSLGFNVSDTGEKQDSDYLRLAETKDFIDYGFEPEFVGRLPVRVVCDPLSADDLEQIMRTSEGSILSQYKGDFSGYDIDFHVTPEAVGSIARKAHTEKTGARGLMTVLERTLRSFKFELPSTAIRRFEVNEQTVENPNSELEELLKGGAAARDVMLREEVRAFADRFQAEHGLKLVFTKEAASVVTAACLADGKTVPVYCAERFKDFEYGFKLLARNTGKTTFSITEKFVENPEKELSARVARSFKKLNGAEDEA